MEHRGPRTAPLGSPCHRGRQQHGRPQSSPMSRGVPRTRLPNGIVLQEVWQQRGIPAEPNDRPEPGWTLGPAAPTEGAVVRILTVPAANGEGLAEPELHTDPSLHVITMLSGELVVILEDSEVTLGVGDRSYCGTACMISETFRPAQQRSCIPPSLSPTVAQSTVGEPEPIIPL